MHFKVLLIDIALKFEDIANYFQFISSEIVMMCVYSFLMDY